MAGTVSSDVTDGPVVNVINKRIRALRKKYNRIIQMEESGKALNKEQEETLRSKPFVLTAIDELEKIKQPISVAVSEEVSSALQQKQHNIPPTDSSSEPNENSEANSGEEVEKLKEDSAGNDAVQDLLNLLYFGSLFDVKPQSDFMATMLTRTHERGCCLTYDYVTDDDAAELLGERDLDLISMLGGLLTSRAVDSSLPHKNALLRCAEHAKSWLDNSDQPIVPDSEITYAGLRRKLNKIMDSEYFTKTPEMKAPTEFQAGAFQVPSQGTVIPDNMPDQVEALQVQVQHEQKEEAVTVKTPGIGNFDELSTALDDVYKGGEGEKYSEIHVDSEQTMGEKSEIEKGLEYIAGASSQYHRGGRGGSRGGGGGGGGGGRRGYSNGGGRRGNRGGSRGGGGAYFNGRNQYYEQGDGYYPKNTNHFRGRGGRGGRGSNNNYQVGEGGYLVAN